MSIEAMIKALNTFEKIHQGCGNIIEDNLDKGVTRLAGLVEEDCHLAMLELRQAIKTEMIWGKNCSLKATTERERDDERAYARRI